MFLRNYQQDTPPNLFFYTPDSSITRFMGMEEGQFTLGEIGNYFGLHYSSVSRIVKAFHTKEANS